MARRFIVNARVSSLLVVFALTTIVFTATVAHAVGVTPSTVTVTPSPNGSILGQSITFTAVASGGGGTPTGEVDFYDGGTLIGSAQLSGGTGVFSTAVLGVGTHNVTATYIGDGTYSGNTSSVASFSVSARSAAVAVTASPSTVAVAATTTLTGSVSDTATTGPTPPAGQFLSGLSLPANNLQSLRSLHAASLLPDGTVLITGGLVGGTPISTVELYTPSANAQAGTFASVSGNMKYARSGHAMTQLSDGHTVLITGGNDNFTSELYSYNFAVPGTGSSVSTGPMVEPRSYHTATLLGSSNEVLIIGGSQGGVRKYTVEYYNTVTQTFQAAVGTLAYARAGHSTTLLAQSGTVFTLLIAGGDATGTAELITYDTSANTVTQIGSAIWLTARAFHTATLLPDGRTVLFAGGMQSGVAVASAELYQVPSNLAGFAIFQTVAAPSSLTLPRTFFTATLLNSGLVLFTGGETDPTMTVDLYTPAFDPQGVVNFNSSDGTDLLNPQCTLTIGGAGVSACTDQLIPYEVGTPPRVIYATYDSSDANHATASNNTPITVVKGTQGAISLVFSALPATYGQTGVSAIASGGSGIGQYVYTSTTMNVCTVDQVHGTLTFMSTGNCAINVFKVQDANYNQSATAYGTLPVLSATLTITADSKTKVYGAALPTLTASYAGFVNGDTSASLTTPPTLTTTATAASHVAGNPYAITASGAAIPNYAITYVAGSLTVTTAPLTITANNQTKVYGAALPPLTASYAGFVNGDTSASLTTPPTLTTTATAASHVAGSPYPITASGAADPDYAITYVAGTLTVTTAPLTITANNQTKVYGAALPTLTASYTGLVNGDTPASLATQVTLTTTATAASHVVGSPYPITASGAADSDYAITYVAGTLTVTKAILVNASWTTPLGIIYGTPLSSTQLDAVNPTWTVAGSNGTVAGTWAYIPPSGTVLNAAGSPQTLTALFTPSDTGDYTTESLTTTISVAKATPVIISWPAPAAITYGTGLSGTQLDAVNPIWTVGTTVGPVAGTIAYTLGTGAYEGGAAKTSVAGQAAMGAVLNAGTITLQAIYTPNDTVNYNPTPSFPVPITVNPAPTATVTTVTVMPMATTGGVIYTITATVASPIAAYCATVTCPLPTGSVSFYNGSAIPANLLGTGTLSLVKGIPTATYTTSASQLPTPATPTPAIPPTTITYQVTPLYSGDLDYSAAVSGSTAPSAPVAVTSNVPEYAPTNFPVTLTVAPPAGITLTNLNCSVYSYSLQTTSSSATCTISPAGTTLTGSESMTLTVTLAGGTTTTAALTHFRPMITILGLPVFGLLLFGFSGDGRTSRRRKVMLWLGLVIVLLTLLGLSGCGASFSGGVPLANGGTTPGLYVVQVVGTDSAGNATTVAVIPLQVLQ